MMHPLVKFDAVCQRFGTLEALHDLDFELYQGEVVGLAGLSGSGKSVIAHLLAGLYRPTSGTIWFREQPLRAQGPGTLEVIHQYPLLLNNLSIAANVFLGQELTFGGLGRWLRIPNQARMEQVTRQVLHDLGVELDVLIQQVANLTAEQRQVVSIARTIVRDPDVIIVDEPTILLSYPQQQKLLSLIQRWHQSGKTILLCSTNLDHLFAVTDRILVLREGKMVASFNTDEANREAIVAAMVGHSNHEQITPVIWALENYYRAREKADQLYHHMSTLEKDLVAQGTVNQELLTQLAQQVRALDQANTALQDSHRRVMSEREQERKHLARELHDQIIQDLLSTNYQLEEIESNYADTDELRLELAEVRDAIRHMVEEIRQICGTLRPPTIDSLGLIAAIQSFTRAWSKRTGVEVELKIPNTIGRLPESIELPIFRIIQEGLNNVYRHAEATQVEIEIRHTSPRTLLITLADNGHGVADDLDLARLSANGHYGLLGISERVALLSGNLRLQSRLTGGFVLQVEIPHPRVEMHLESLNPGYAVGRNR